jgi:transcriptional regulator with XRE-family HTH domain
MKDKTYKCVELRRNLETMSFSGPNLFGSSNSLGVPGVGASVKPGSILRFPKTAIEYTFASVPDRRCTFPSDAPQAQRFIFTSGLGRNAMIKKAKQPTLNEVARKAGVGTTTVSRVINGGHLVDPKTLARVRRVIEALGYIPNQAARTLKGARNPRKFEIVQPSAAERGETSPRFWPRACYLGCCNYLTVAWTTCSHSVFRGVDGEDAEAMTA